MIAYGIRRGRKILCIDKLGFKCFMPPHYKGHRPVIVYSAYEIDNILQDIATRLNDYTLEVCQFTEEELEQFAIDRLKGH